MEKELPLYLVTGFLGAGKSTFLRGLLEKERTRGRRVGVLVNEIGAVSVDGSLLRGDDSELIEVNGGSIFCPCMKGGFGIALQRFLDTQVEALFVEASGMADPFGMDDFITQLEKAKEDGGTLYRRYEYRGALCIVDVVDIVDYADVLESVRNQIKKASLILLNKVDKADARELQESRELIAELNPTAFLYETSFGNVPLDVFEEQMTPDSSAHGVTTNRCADRPANYVIDLPRRYEREKMLAFMGAMSAFAVRQKGFFHDDAGVLVHAEAVGDDVSVESFTPRKGEVLGRQLVIIGLGKEEFEGDIVREWGKVFSGSPCFCMVD